MSRGCLRDGVGAAVVPMLWCGSLTPSADLLLEMLFRMTPGRELLAVGFGGDDVGCAWMMITRRAGRMLARSITPWGIGVWRCGVMHQSAVLTCRAGCPWILLLCRGAAWELVSVLRWYEGCDAAA